jgi:uncharacterized protein YdeI (BOF family)
MWSNGKKKKGWKHSPQKNNSIHNSVRNEENGYPVPDLNKIMINVTKEPSDTHIITFKGEILKDITENSLDTKNKKY